MDAAVEVAQEHPQVAVSVSARGARRLAALVVHRQRVAVGRVADGPAAVQWLHVDRGGVGLGHEPSVTNACGTHPPPSEQTEPGGGTARLIARRDEHRYQSLDIGRRISTMHAPKRLVATVAVAAALAGIAPAAAGAATPTLPQFPSADPNLCLKGVTDLGPFGPYGPYGPSGPYGPNGPMAGQPNPIGNAATCGGLITYVLRGGTLQGFIQASTAGLPH
jgi:hypothetical protein